MTVPAANIPPSVWQGVAVTPAVLPAVPAGHCAHGGTVYRHGHMFASTTTALRPTKHNQCVVCQCQVSVQPAAGVTVPDRARFIFSG